MATSPLASILVAAFLSAGEKGADTLPSRTKRSPTASLPEEGSMTRALAIQRRDIDLFRCGHGLGLAAGAEIEHGHADCYAVRNLLEDHTPLAVGQLAVDLDSPVDRARGA